MELQFSTQNFDRLLLLSSDLAGFMEAKLQPFHSITISGSVME